jgi:hypothetical protein
MAHWISLKTSSWNSTGFNFGLIRQTIFVEVVESFMPKLRHEKFETRVQPVVHI